MAAPRTYSSPRLPSFPHVLYDNPSLPPTMLAYLPHWQSPPPPIPHKVYILDCRSCATFITNRGMKAVLLLRPTVSLFSSDALPTNCSPYTTNPDALRPRNLLSSQLPSRTCECLTQTLCCHGCGSTIGYMIVVPCTRCTSSISTTNRATNGHRFVFHSTEVVNTERCYVPDEPGVIPYDPPGTPIMPEPNIQTFLYSPATNTHADPQDHVLPRSRSPSPAHVSDYLPTPPLEFATPTFAPPTAPTFDAFPFPRGHNYTSSEPYPSSHAPGPYPPYFLPHPHSSFSPVSHPSRSPYQLINRPSPPAFSRSGSTSSPPLTHTPFPLGVPVEQKEHPSPRKLQAGDTLYWHHLAKNGEIPGVEEDERARGNNKLTATGGKLPATPGFNR